MENKQNPEQEQLLPTEQIRIPEEIQESPACEEMNQPLEQLLPETEAEQPDSQPQVEMAADTMPQEEEFEEEAMPESDLILLESAVPAQEEAPALQSDGLAVFVAGAEAQPLFENAPYTAEDYLPEEPQEEPQSIAVPEETDDPTQLEDPLERELQEVAQLLAEPSAPDRKFRETEESDGQFAEMVNTPAPKAPIPAHDRPTRKGRPRRKKGEGLLGIPSFLSTLVWLGITLVIGVTLGRMLWVCAADVLAFGREDKSVTITIYESDTIDDVTNKLHRANLIRYPGLFKLYASFAVDEDEIRPGIWDLNTRYDYHALVNMMSPSSTRKVVEVMIPEGYSCRQIFELLEENKVCTALDLAAYAANGELNEYWFLGEIPRGEENCLEGYLFPDTYQFYTNDTPRNVLQKMLDNFDNRFTEEMALQLPLLNEEITSMMVSEGKSQEYIDSHQLTLKDVVIVASLIEKETATAEEGYTIASVIYNRLYHWGGTPAFLNIDATMVYALGKNDITAEDLKIDHPYNTYLYTGLTPGPISNPGLSSLKAALDPKSTNYYYYVLDPAAGEHHFSTTYEEHQAFIASLGD